MKVLGIESSCDETAAAVVVDGVSILSDVVHSQDVHRAYGGVVPELAARDHLARISQVTARALDLAGTRPLDIDLVAASSMPGLAGALLVGACFAKGLAAGLGKPWVAVNHVAAHADAAFLEHPQLRPPLLALIVSGGHTSIFLMDERGEMQLMGQTLDDAAGEAFDKVAKMLDLGYPGGPAIERRAARSRLAPVKFPRALLGEDSLDFSFSGLKTAVLNHIAGPGGAAAPLTDQQKDAICAGFQSAVFAVLAEKLRRAIELTGCRSCVLAGGVAANAALRATLQRMCDAAGAGLVAPRPQLCTDNAAMVAASGHRQFLRTGASRGEAPVNSRVTWPPYRAI
ncbi:MAG TPA: tRNA (adenosine(37)-N6)-threonylcarbamoyltransferase complex transferase subunit TsaD [Candidatus Edwardsbacteria bacterium]|nr:tRNA (adenosine(37)-N6)-threonylcarbamoyltransferase complex transferase subunit TsaD [Candidatus Edwardsbacteria bacterium]